MALLDFYQGWNPKQAEEEQLAQIAPPQLQLLGELTNPELMAQAQAEQQMAAPAQAPTTSQAPQQESTDEQKFEEGFGKGLFNAFSNPDTMTLLQAFGASMANDREGYNNAMTAYSQRLNDRKIQRNSAKTQESMESRQERMAFRKSLYDSYRPEYVSKYMSTLTDPQDLMSGDMSIFSSPDALRVSLRQADDRIGIASNNSNISQQNANTNTGNLQEKQRQFDTEQNNAGFNGGVLLGDGTTRVAGAGAYPGKDGNWYIVKQTPQGLTVELDKDTTEANSGAQSTSTFQQNKDIATVRNAANSGKADAWTGQLVGRVGAAGDLASSFSDEETREAYRAAERIDGLQLTAGISEAKALGASGINTVAEAQNFFRGMPRLDKTSVQNLLNSLDKIEAYVAQHNASVKARKVKSTGEQAPSQPSQAPQEAAGVDDWVQDDQDPTLFYSPSRNDFKRG